MTVQVNPAIFCDDIRYEASGKLVLVGVYMERLVPKKLPVGLRLAIFSRVYGLSVGKHAMVAEFWGDGEVKVRAEAEIDLHIADVGMSIPLGPVAFQLAKAGPILVKFSFDDGQPLDGGRLDVLDPASQEARDRRELLSRSHPQAVSPPEPSAA